MRRSRVAMLFLLAALILGLLAPAAGAVAEHSRFHGLYFPAGMEGTNTDCPYTWQEMPPMCIMAAGSQAVLPDGRLLIRDIELYELALAWRGSGAVEPRKTGYDLVIADAILDNTFSGPTWGTWNLWSFGADLENPADDFVMFSGIFFGRFKNGIPGVHYFGAGTGVYDGQHMGGIIRRAPNADGWNMFGHIIEQG